MTVTLNQLSSICAIGTYEALKDCAIFVGTGYGICFLLGIFMNAVWNRTFGGAK